VGEREFFIDNLRVRIHLVIEMISVDRPCAVEAVGLLGARASGAQAGRRLIPDGPKVDTWSKVDVTCVKSLQLLLCGACPQSALLGGEGPAWGWCEGSALRESGFLPEETEGALGAQGAMRIGNPESESRRGEVN